MAPPTHRTSSRVRTPSPLFVPAEQLRQRGGTLAKGGNRNVANAEYQKRKVAAARKRERKRQKKERQAELERKKAKAAQPKKSSKGASQTSACASETNRLPSHKSVDDKSRRLVGAMVSQSPPAAETETPTNETRSTARKTVNEEVHKCLDALRTLGVSVQALAGTASTLGSNQQVQKELQDDIVRTTKARRKKTKRDHIRSAKDDLHEYQRANAMVTEFRHLKTSVRAATERQLELSSESWVEADARLQTTKQQTRDLY